MNNVNYNNVKTTRVDRQTAIAILASREGKFLTVDAIKKDGTLTRQNGKLATGSSSLKKHPHFRTIKRSRSGEYRVIDVNRVTRIAFDKQVIEVIQ